MKQNSSQRKTQTPLIFLSIGTVILAALWFWLKPPPPPCGGHCMELGTDYHLVFDQSQSRKDAAEQNEWRKTALSIAANLKGGDSICISGINAHSDQTAVLFQDRMPVMPEDPTSEEEKRIRETWKRVRKEAQEAVEAALHPAQRAVWSDVFGALDHIKVLPQRATQIVIFSDMLHSQADGVDFERVRLTAETSGEILTKAAGKYRWERGRWGNGKVQVHCILNSLDMRAARPLNDRIALDKLWRSLFEFLSNDKDVLTTFGPQLPFNRIEGGPKNEEIFQP